jgi:hypothetical protein
LLSRGPFSFFLFPFPQQPNFSYQPMSLLAQFTPRGLLHLPSPLVADQ